MLLGRGFILKKLLILSVVVCFSTNQLALAETGEPGRVARAVGRTAEVGVNFSAEMARFFTAVAVVNYWDCAREGDPVKCQVFLESLQDPNTYIGFAAFVAAANGTSYLSMKLTNGRLSGHFLGMAAGMFASELYGEFIAHPIVKELRKTSSKGKRKELLQKLWADSMANRTWWENKVPSLVGLFGGYAASAATIPLVKSGITATKVAIISKMLVSKGRDAAKALKIAQRAVRMSASRVNPWVFVASQIGELVVFIKYSEVIEKPFRKWWSESRATKALNIELNKLEQKLSESTVTEKDIMAVESAWDRFRGSQFESALALQSSYAKEGAEFEKKLLSLYLHDVWIATGSRDDSPLIKENALEWKPGDPKSKWEHLDAFFCGPSAKSAVKRALTVAGLPLPGRSQDDIVPFRIIDTPDACTNEDKFIPQTRKQDFTPFVDKAFEQILPQAALVREDLIKAYNKRIATTLEGNLLNGTDSRSDYKEPIRINNHEFQRGVIPSYLQELAYWKSLDNQHSGRSGDLFNKAVARLNEKRHAAQDLLNYVMNPVVRSETQDESFDGLLGEETPDWEKVVQQWKSFIMKPITAMPNATPNQPASESLGL